MPNLVLIILGVLVCIWLVLWGFDVGTISGKQEMLQEAIKNYAAHWEINAQTGEKKLVWHSKQ